MSFTLPGQHTSVTGIYRYENAHWVVQEGALYSNIYLRSVRENILDCEVARLAAEVHEAILHFSQSLCLTVRCATHEAVAIAAHCLRSASAASANADDADRRAVLADEARDTADVDAE